MFRGAVQQLVGVLGVEELGELVISRRDLARVASVLHPLMLRRSELLEERKRYSEGTPEREEVQARLERVEAELETIGKSPLVRELLEQATEVHGRLEEAEAAFRQTWDKLTGGTGRAEDVDLDALCARVTAALEGDRQFLKELNEDLKRLDADLERLLGSENLAARRQALEWRSRLLQEYIQPTRLRVQRLESLRAILSAPGRLQAEGVPAARIRRAQQERDRLLRETEKVARSGITDFPVWMVQAFTEQGWSWGGGWHEPMDAMHFDYMGPVEETQ